MSNVEKIISDIILDLSGERDLFIPVMINNRPIVLMGKELLYLCLTYNIETGSELGYFKKPTRQYSVGKKKHISFIDEIYSEQCKNLQYIDESNLELGNEGIERIELIECFGRSKVGSINIVSKGYDYLLKEYAYNCKDEEFDKLLKYAIVTQNYLDSMAYFKGSYQNILNITSSLSNTYITGIKLRNLNLLSILTNNDELYDYEYESGFKGIETFEFDTNIRFFDFETKKITQPVILTVEYQVSGACYLDTDIGERSISRILFYPDKTNKFPGICMVNDKVFRNYFNSRSNTIHNQRFKLTKFEEVPIFTFDEKGTNNFKDYEEFVI